MKFNPFQNWLRPVFFSGFTLLLALAGMVTEVGIIELAGGTLFLVSLVWILASLIYLLLKKEWSKSAYTFLFILALAIVFGLAS